MNKIIIGALCLLLLMGLVIADQKIFGNLNVQNDINASNIVAVGQINSTGNATFNGFHIDKINATHHKLWGE